MLLVDDGRPAARIVVAPTSPPVERHAAQELQRYLRRISGAQLPLSEHPEPGEGAVFVGEAVPAGLAARHADLGRDGYFVTASASSLYLGGAQGYSSLYAVYDLLETRLGCGFFEDGDQVPHARTIAVGQLDAVERPRFEWRAYHNNMQYAYSGMMWWDDAQLMTWVDYLAKKRLNVWQPCRIVDSSGLVAAAARRMGVPIEFTAWQRERLATVRTALQYADRLGIAPVYSVTQWNQGMEGNQNEPGAYPFSDRAQLEAFVEGYAQRTGHRIPVLTYEWCGTRLPCLDPRDPAAQRFVGSLVESYRELFGVRPIYWLCLPSEGGWASEDADEMDRVTYAMLDDLVRAVRAADPQAVVWAAAPFEYARTFAAQRRAVQDAGLPVGPDFWLNVPGRYHSFLQNDYYWGLPWLSGMVSHCGTHTNPWGDMRTAIANARELGADPRAKACRGFAIGNEMCHRNIMLMDLFAALAWDPARVELDDFVRRYAERRYGPQPSGAMLEATRAVGRTLLSHYNMDGTNGPLYRRWMPTYLPGLTPASVKRTLGWLPQLRRACEGLLEDAGQMPDSPLLRFDLVDIGRTYLGALFNYHFARARLAFRAGDRQDLARHREHSLATMRSIAALCSAHPQFRLATWDEWAGRWPPLVPGYDNTDTNWLIFTALISGRSWRALLDYVAEDLAELVLFYYLPRVDRYLAQMDRMLAAGEPLSGRLVYRDTDTHLPYRTGDFAPAAGLLPWSAFGDVAEPELTADDTRLAHELIEAGSLSGRVAPHPGPPADLLRHLLEAHPLPDDLDRTLAGEEPGFAEQRARRAAAPSGETLYGYETPQPVERVEVPQQLRYLVQMEKVREEYTLMRGPVTGWIVRIGDMVRLRRLADEPAPGGGVQRCCFEIGGAWYLLRYDPGCGTRFPSLAIVPSGHSVEGPPDTGSDR